MSDMDCPHGSNSRCDCYDVGRVPMPTPARDEALRDRVARVLGEHRAWVGTIRGRQANCACGWRFGDDATSDDHEAHVADALLGVLADSRAEAWDEGHRFTGYEPERGENPYRKEATDG